MKKVIALVAILAMAAVSVFGFNYVMVGSKLAGVIHDDPRNVGVNISAHYDYYVNPSVLVLDMRGIALTDSMADVFRVVMQLSYRTRDMHLQTVKFESQGIEKYSVSGADFQQLGTVVDGQNPVYLMRTFPEKVMLPDGTHAFGTWTGGLLGVLGQQMEEFNRFHRGWYMDDMFSTKER